jgi:hypothetical protein
MTPARLLVSVSPCLLVLAATASAPAQSTQPAPQPPQETTALLAPYLDQSTLLAAHADLARLDIPAAIHFLEQEFAAAHLPKLDLPLRNIAGARKTAQALLAQFQSLGGRHVYLLMDQVNTTPDPASLAFLIPLDEKADRKGVADLLRTLAPPDLTVAPLRENLLFVGLDKTFNHLSRIAPAARPDLLAAFAAPPHHDPAPCTFAFAVGGDFRRALLDSRLFLPQELGGTPVATLVNPLRAAGLSLQTSPAPALTLVLATDDKDNARHLAAVINADLTLLVKAITAEAERSADTRALLPVIQELPRLLAPTVDDRALLITLDKNALSRLTALMTPSVVRAQEASLRIQSIRQMRQITVAAIMYEQEHGTWPDSLAALDLPEGITSSPRDLKNPAYDYHPWSPAQLKVLGGAQVPVLWEQPNDPSQPLSVAFTDGHVEVVSAQSALDDLLQQAQDKLDAAARQPASPTADDPDPAMDPQQDPDPADLPDAPDDN